jgi:uncharacterized membrane protein YeiB
MITGSKSISRRINSNNNRDLTMSDIGPDNSPVPVDDNGLGPITSNERFISIDVLRGVAVIGLQLMLSPWWLSRYRFGPVEWLWRSLTYWTRQPFRQQESVASR